jgi:hypothetical protein
MNRFPFYHVDEIRLRLSDQADIERLHRLASSSESDEVASRLDGFLQDMGERQRQIMSILHRKMQRRSGATTAYLA